MDSSSLREAAHQQQHQPYVPQPYDPSQFQAHDQSIQSYHSYHQQYPYQQSYYANGYHQQHEFANVQNPGQLHHPQNAFPGLNATAADAVAALTLLTQFAGTMGAGEKTNSEMYANGVGYYPRSPPGGRSRYRGGGRGGAGPYRGGGRGNSGHRQRTGSVPPFRGRRRDRGRGGCGSFAPQDAESTDSGAQVSVVHDQEIQAAVPPEMSVVAPALGEIASNQQSQQVARCEICKVYCNSYEILEQHKNGKRHKKNLWRFEELKSVVKPGADIQNEQKPLTESNPEGPRQPENAQSGVENKSIEILPAEAGSGKTQMDTQQQNITAEQPCESSNWEAGKASADNSATWKPGTKRKMKGKRGEKRMKTSEATKRSVEPPKPKVAIPLICDLCNVKCDTQEVFDRHLSGKKHIAKVRRFEGHQAMYGPVGLQVLYPPNPITRTFLPQGLQQPFYGPQGSYMPPEAYQGGPAAAAAFPGFPNQNDVAVVPEAQNQLATIEP